MPTRDVYRAIPFDGLAPDDDSTAPDEYVNHVNDGDPIERSFAEAVAFAAEEYNIASTSVAYRDPQTGEWVEVDHWQATVNPAWTGDPQNVPPIQREHGKGAAWHTPTEEYTPIGPDEWYDPLVAALADRGMNVYGVLRLSRAGGVQVFDVFFPDHQVAFPDQPDKTLGVTTGHDYYGGRKLSANTIALDAYEDGSVAVMRNLTDARKRKHTGDADDEVKRWWTGIIDRTDAVAETLYGVVTDAMNYDVALAEMPCTIPEFYAHLGLPETTLAQSAAERAIETCRGQWDAYHLHRAGIHVLENEYGGKDSRRFAQHLGTLNALLFNPAQAERDVLQSIHEDLDAEQADITNGDWADTEQIRSQQAAVAERIDNISDGVEEFASARERLRTMLTDIQDAEDQDQDQDQGQDQDQVQEAGA